MTTQHIPLNKEVEFLSCHLVAGEFDIRWQHLLSFINIVQLCKTDCTYLRDMLGCRALLSRTIVPSVSC